VILVPLRLTTVRPIVTIGALSPLGRLSRYSQFLRIIRINWHFNIGVTRRCRNWAVGRVVLSCRKLNDHFDYAQIRHTTSITPRAMQLQWLIGC